MRKVKSIIYQPEMNFLEIKSDEKAEKNHFLSKFRVCWSIYLSQILENLTTDLESLLWNFEKHCISAAGLLGQQIITSGDILSLIGGKKDLSIDKHDSSVCIAEII